MQTDPLENPRETTLFHCSQRHWFERLLPRITPFALLGKILVHMNLTTIEIGAVKIVSVHLILEFLLGPV